MHLAFHKTNALKLEGNTQNTLVKQLLTHFFILCKMDLTFTYEDGKFKPTHL